MSRPPQLILSPLINGRPAPQCDPATYTPAAGRSYLVVPLTTINTAPTAALPRRQRQPPYRGPAPTGGPVFSPDPLRRSRAARPGLAEWFTGADHARSVDRGAV